LFDLQCNGSFAKEKELGAAFQNNAGELTEGFPCQNAFTCHKNLGFESTAVNLHQAESPG